MTKCRSLRRWRGWPHTGDPRQCRRILRLKGARGGPPRRARGRDRLAVGMGSRRAFGVMRLAERGVGHANLHDASSVKVCAVGRWRRVDIYRLGERAPRTENGHTPEPERRGHCKHLLVDSVVVHGRVGCPLHVPLLAAHVCQQGLETLPAHLCAQGIDGSLRDLVKRRLWRCGHGVKQRGLEIGEPLDQHALVGRAEAEGLKFSVLRVDVLGCRREKEPERNNIRNKVGVDGAVYYPGLRMWLAALEPWGGPWCAKEQQREE